jgi:hypothetical protein
MYVSGERAWCVRRVILGRGMFCNECGTSGSFYHRERPVIHDEPSQARGRFEVCQLRHGSHDFAFAAPSGPGRWGKENFAMKLSEKGS